MKFILKVFSLVFFILLPNNFLNSAEINCLSPVHKNKPICILIGPEGDFSENERELMSQLQNIRSLKINRNILRTETAAIAMISILTFKHLS